MDPSNVDSLEKRKADIHRELGQVRAQLRAAKRKAAGLDANSPFLSARTGDQTARPAPSASPCSAICSCCGGGGAASDDEDVEAQQPLVPKKEVSNRHFGTLGATPRSIVVDEADAEELRSHFDYPSEFELIVTQFAMSLGYTCYVMTAWLYAGAVRQLIFKDCTHTWGHLVGVEFICESSALAFWTLPLYAGIVLHVWYYRDLLCIRLYYEMLAHNVFLDFENVPFFQANATRLFVVWMLAAMLLYPLGAANLMSMYGIKITAPFWVPLGSFIGGVLYASWDLETRLLSLSKYVEREFDDAKVHIDSSLFMPDYIAKQGFQAARASKERAMLQNGGGEDVSPNARAYVDGSYTTGMYIRDMAIKARELESAGLLKPANHGDASTGQSSLFSAFNPNYWVTQFLYCPYLMDERAKKFRMLFRVYMVYLFIMVGLLLYLFFATCISHLQRQGRIEPNAVTNFFHIEPFLIMPVAAPPQAP